MTCRALIGRHPWYGHVGMWVAKPGYDCISDDRTDRNKFYLSTDFADRRPFRIIRAGLINSNTPIFLPSPLAGLGGEPMLTYRVMETSERERESRYYGSDNDGSGGTYAGSEFMNRLIDGNPAYYLIQRTGDYGNTGSLLRYMVALV